MGLRSTLLSIVKRDLPDSTSVIDQSSPRFDELMGGKIAAGKWKRFETGFGTTCAATVDGWLLEAGAPPELIDATQEDGGSGWTAGSSFSRLMSGAKSLGWYMAPERGQLPEFRPGDIYIINHASPDGTTNNAHVGVVVSATPSTDGQSVNVETADGGQGTRTDQQIKRNTRLFKIGSGAHAVDVQSPSGPGWLEWIVRVGGDEADEAPPSAPSGGSDEPPPATLPTGAGTGGSDTGGVRSGDDTGLVLGLSAFGALLVVGALSWYAGSGKTPKFFGAMKRAETDLTINLIDRSSTDLDTWFGKRDALERALDRTGFDITGSGAMVGQSGPLRSDLSVATSRRDAPTIIRDLARRAGLAVESVVPFDV